MKIRWFGWLVFISVLIMLCVVAGPFVLILLPLIMLFAGHQAEIDIANYKLAKRRAEEERKIKEREREIKEREREREREIIIEKQQFQKDMLIFKNEVEAMVNVLYEDKQAKKLIHNFFNKFPQDILLNKDYLIFFRREVVNLNGKIGDLALDYPNAQSAKSYFSNDEVYSVFDMLVKVFLRNINILPESHCKFVIWLTIERYAIDYFSDIWFKKYGHYFLDIENLSLEQCVSNYCLIDIFNRDSFDNIGMFTYFLMKNGKFTNSGDGFISSNSYLTPLVLKEIEEKKIESFERNLLDPKTKITFSMNDIDLMNGIEFENFVSLLFKKMNYSTEITKGSGDQGIDIIAEKNEERIGIQAKCYSNSVSNSAIQEVVAGISHYRCSKGIVVTNNFFTKSAIELASSNNIVLWDRDILKEKIMELF